MRKRVGVVADDVTGANDIGIMFVKGGYRSAVFPLELIESCDLKKEAEGLDAIIIDTDNTCGIGTYIPVAGYSLWNDYYAIDYAIFGDCLLLRETYRGKLYYHYPVSLSSSRESEFAAIGAIEEAARDQGGKLSFGYTLDIEASVASENTISINPKSYLNDVSFSMIHFNPDMEYAVA